MAALRIEPPLNTPCPAAGVSRLACPEQGTWFLQGVHPRQLHPRRIPRIGDSRIAHPLAPALVPEPASQGVPHSTIPFDHHWLHRIQMPTVDPAISIASLPRHRSPLNPPIRSSLASMDPVPAARPPPRYFCSRQFQVYIPGGVPALRPERVAAGGWRPRSLLTPPGRGKMDFFRSSRGSLFLKP